MISSYSLAIKCVHLKVLVYSIGKRELLEAMPPFLLGGDMIEYVKEQTATFNELPYKFEAGTQMLMVPFPCMQLLII